MSKKPSILNEKAKEAKEKASLLGNKVRESGIDEKAKGTASSIGNKVKESGIDEKAKEAKDKASLFGNKAKESLKGSSLFNRKKSE